MSVYNDFFIDFMSPIFEGLAMIFTNLFTGLFQMFNILNYIEVVSNYSDELSGSGSIIIILSVICLIIIYAVIAYFIYYTISRAIHFKKNRYKTESMVDEIDRLNIDIVRLKEENQNFLTMIDPESSEIEYDENGNIVNKVVEGETRFFRLSKIDDAMENYKAPKFNKKFTLEEFCDHFRNYSASRLHLYYDIKLIRLFMAAFASNRLIILQGISGTGKTSLAYAFGMMIENETTIASVQPSWRDSSELFGYFNEFTKRYNETQVLSKLYESTYKEDVYLTLLDEMNISRVEYYFAEMLSILELPNKKDWVIDLVPNAWPNDPKNIKEGRFHLPENMWYVGTINNDDSTFMVTDKVYDRAMPINIDNKCEVFNAPDTDPIRLSATYMNKLFEDAQNEYKVSDELLEKIAEMDRYVIDHFRLAFGNRIVKHIREFVPAYVACGGTVLEGLDYVLANKILRKFEQLNLAFIKNEIDGYIDYMNKLFGKGKMKECIAYLERLKKTI